MKEITKTLPIAEILEIVPDAVEIMLDEGLHCVGCDANTMETLEEGMIGHGFSDDEITIMVTKIEALRRNQAAKADQLKKPEKEDFMAQKIEKGNKTYYQVAGMMFNEKSYDAIHALANGKSGLQIRIEAGGCAGYSMKYDYQDAPKEDEKAYSLSNKIDLYLNDFTFDKLHDSIVDYESGLHGSGLKFINPNTKASCSCGTSVAF